MPLAADVLLLATRSHDKAREIRSILHDSHLRIMTLDEATIPFLPEEDDVEVFDTFLDNAHAKAAYFRKRTGMSVLADDSGISVDALGGAPGVKSRRFALDTETAGPASIDEANNRLLLARLEGVPDTERSAHYTCAVALHLPDGRRFAAIGTCSGSILTAPRGSCGFGYDPLFRDPASGLSFAELDAALKNHRSHRSRAVRALAGLAPFSSLQRRV